MDTAEIRAAWLKQLFSTDPVDRPRAEGAAKSLYEALEIPAPRQVLWFENPSDGAWAAAILLAPVSLPWGGILSQVEQDPAGRATVNRMRERLQHLDGGAYLEDRLRRKRLFTARFSLYPDLPALQGASIFNDDDDLYRAENHFRGPARGVIGFQESAGRARGLMKGSLLSIYPMSLMASDEAQAAGGAVPLLLEALWEIARSSGPWWAFEHAILLTERPREIHLNDRRLPHSPVVRRLFTGMAGRCTRGKANLSTSRDRPSRCRAACKNFSRPVRASPCPRVLQSPAIPFSIATRLASTKRSGTC